MHSDHGANFISWGSSENLRSWGRMQTELLSTRKTWRTVMEVVTAMDTWVDFYDGRRRHRYPGCMSPHQCEALWNDLNTATLEESRTPNGTRSLVAESNVLATRNYDAGEHTRSKWPKFWPSPGQRCTGRSNDGT